MTLYKTKALLLIFTFEEAEVPKHRRNFPGTRSCRSVLDGWEGPSSEHCLVDNEVCAAVVLFRVLLFVCDRVLFCSSGWRGTRSIDQAGPELSELPCFCFPSIRIDYRSTHAWLWRKKNKLLDTREPCKKSLRVSLLFAVAHACQPSTRQKDVQSKAAMVTVIRLTWVKWKPGSKSKKF